MSYQLESLARMDNYYRWILQEFEPYLGKRVLEIGAGSGTFSSMLLTAQVVERLWLVEPDAGLAEELTARFAGETKVTVLRLAAEELTVELLTGLQLDAIVMVNVLEHIEDDLALLRRCANTMQPGGRLLTFSPASSLLYSEYDRLVGHFRRYAKEELRARFASANFRIVQIKYFNFIGFFAWLILVRLLRVTTFGDQKLRLFDALLGKVQLLERRFPPPLGQSVIAIGVTPA